MEGTYGEPESAAEWWIGLRLGSVIVDEIKETSRSFGDLAGSAGLRVPTNPI